MHDRLAGDRQEDAEVRTQRVDEALLPILTEHLADAYAHREEPDGTHLYQNARWGANPWGE